MCAPSTAGSPAAACGSTARSRRWCATPACRSRRRCGWRPPRRRRRSARRARGASSRAPTPTSWCWTTTFASCGRSPPERWSMSPRDLPAALLFDFDGTILETEGPSYRSWQELFDEHGLELTLDAWSVTVGALNLVDPVAMLEEALGREVDGDGLRRRRMRRKLELVAEEALRPGVEQLIADARRHGLRLGIVTSASGDWVRRHLTRLHLDEAWDVIVAADGDPERAKPAPVVYLEALELLEIAADDAIAIEDSPNGVRAAKAAGIPCVAVPNPITRRLDLSEADVVLDTLDGAGVADLAAAAGTIQRT